MAPEFQANSYTTGYQNEPQVASDPNGNFVVVWQGYGPNLGGSGVFARLFDNTGSPLGAEFVVNGFTAAHYASLAMNESGNFVVVWQSGQDNSQDGVYAEKYDSSGLPTTGLIPVNTYTTGQQGHARVAIDSAGDFVVVWTSHPSLDPSDYDVFGQRFDAAGNKLGGEFPVNTSDGDANWFPDIAMNSSGEFVVVWSNQPVVPGDPGPEIWAQRYDSAGSAQGGQIHVNQYTTNAQQAPKVGMDAAGNFVVTWQTIGQFGGSGDVAARRFASSGSALADEF